MIAKQQQQKDGEVGRRGVLTQAAAKPIMNPAISQLGNVVPVHINTQPGEQLPERRRTSIQHNTQVGFGL
jgi:hypothetical protein